MGVATPIELADDERETLSTWVRRATTEQRMVQRARIVLEAVAGKTKKEVATLLQVRPATVSRWRTRFARHRIAGLGDAPRSGKPPKYDEITERRILAQLDQPPPEGCTVWTGGLVAKALRRHFGTARVAGLAPARYSLAAAAQLVCQYRSSVCPESSRHRGPVSGPSRECRGNQCGRETGHPGPRAGPGVAAPSQRAGGARA